MTKHTKSERRKGRKSRFVQELEGLTDVTVKDISKLPKRKPRRRTPRSISLFERRNRSF